MDFYMADVTTEGVNEYIKKFNILFGQKYVLSVKCGLLFG